MSTERKEIVIWLTFILMVSGILTNACNENQPFDPNQAPACAEARFGFRKLTLAAFPPDTINGVPIRCVLFQNIRPLFIGDTIVVVVSQNFNVKGAPVIDMKPVYVTITSKLGDKETYWLRGGTWPCETRMGDVEIRRALIPYSVTSKAFLHNTLLEVTATGDTLVASYVSYCTGDTLLDKVALLPR